MGLILLDPTLEFLSRGEPGGLAMPVGAPSMEKELRIPTVADPEGVKVLFRKRILLSYVSGDVWEAFFLGFSCPTLIQTSGK